MIGTHGILDPHAGAAHFALARVAPSAALAPFVERYWLIRWDLRGRPAYAQETLPYPCVNLVVGTHQPGVFGPATRRFVAELVGLGWVIGAKFRPGGFRAFTATPMIDLVDRGLAIGAIFGDAGHAVARAIHAAPDDAGRIAALDQFLCARAPIAHPELGLVGRIVELAEAEPAIARVADLAGRVDLPVRTLERLFRRHIGLPPKTVIRRFRVQQAAARVAGGAPVAWSALAHELGYCDQAHFIRDFKAQVGRTPAQYAQQCAPAIAVPA
jgi:AraC-like DNA-binding protein